MNCGHFYANTKSNGMKNMCGIEPCRPFVCGSERACSRSGATPLELGRFCDGYPGWLVPRDPGLEAAAPLGLNLSRFMERASDFLRQRRHILTRSEEFCPAAKAWTISVYFAAMTHYNKGVTTTGLRRFNAPTGHRREAQGCEERATLGQHTKIRQPQTGLCQPS
jgi:hypothetical protein